MVWIPLTILTHFHLCMAEITQVCLTLPDKKLVIFVHFKGFNISQKPKSSPLSYFAQKTSLNLAPN